MGILVDWCTNEAQNFPVMFTSKLALLLFTVYFFSWDLEGARSRVKFIIKVVHKRRTNVSNEITSNIYLLS